MWPALAMAALGAAQYYDQSKKAEKQKTLQAETARYSPWTGMQANTNPLEASVVGTVGSGLVSGMQLEQGMNANEAQQDYQNKMLEQQTRYNNILERNGSGAPSQGPMTGQQQWGQNPFAAEGPYQDPNAYQQPGQQQGVWPMMVANRR